LYTPPDLDFGAARHEYDHFFGEVMHAGHISFNTTTRTRIVLDEKHNITGVWTHTENSENNDFVVYYIHGGGWSWFSSDVVAGTIERYSLTLECPILSVDYRLSPENPFPIGLGDIVHGYKELLKNYSAEKVVAIGESAGANLLLAFLIALRDARTPMPAAAIAVCGAYAFDFNLPSFFENQFRNAFTYGHNGTTLKRLISNTGYIPDGVFETLKYNPLVSPYHGNVRGLPPIQFWAAERENLRDDTIYMYRKCLEEGVYAELKIKDYDLHAWVLFPYLNETIEAELEMYDFIKRVL